MYSALSESGSDQPHPEGAEYFRSIAVIYVTAVVVVLLLAYLLAALLRPEWF